MIIKGKSRAGPGSLASHLGNAEKNERVQVLETHNTIAQDLRGALIEMDAVASGTRCTKPFYHAAISPEPPHRLTPEQRSEAIDALEKKMGLEDHARVVVLHEKEGREHLHVVWSRIDIKTMTAAHDGHNYRRHEEVARDLERRFGHERVQGAHAEREGPDGKIARPDRTPSRAELRQEERTGIKGKDVKQEVSGLFRASDGAEAFKTALEEHGYQLAKGDRRDFVIVDQGGGVHSLARRIDGVKASELREFMAPLDRESAPSVDEARAQIEERQRQAQEASDEAKREKAHGRGDYVSQSRAALKEHKRRQEELNERAGRDSAWERIEAGETRREQPETAAPEASEEVHRRELRKRADDDRRRRGDERGDDRSNRAADSTPANVEITDAMQARLDRLHEAQGGAAAQRDGPSPQNEAPGGGRTRSR